MSEEMLNRYKARVKAQNEAAKEKWDSVSCRLPKGAKERITKLGLTVNGYINELVLADLERLESEAKNNAAEPQKQPQKEKSATYAEDFDRLNEYIKSRQAENEERRLSKAEVLKNVVE